MARPSKPSGDPVPPRDMPNVVPVDVANAGQTRLLIDAVKETVAELRSDVKEIKRYRHTDFLWHMGVFGGGFLLLAGLALHLYARLEDKLQALSTATTRVETKLDGLLRSPSESVPLPKK